MLSKHSIVKPLFILRQGLTKLPMVTLNSSLASRVAAATHLHHQAWLVLFFSFLIYGITNKLQNLDFCSPHSHRLECTLMTLHFFPISQIKRTVYKDRVKLSGFLSRTNWNSSVQHWSLAGQDNVKHELFNFLQICHHITAFRNRKMSQTWWHISVSWHWEVRVQSQPWL